MTPRATITAAKMIARVSERQSSNVSPHAHCRPLEISQMSERRDRGKEQQGQREFVPPRRLHRRAGGAPAALRRSRRAHQPCDQEGQYADDGDNDHGLDEDCRSLFQGTS